MDVFVRLLTDGADVFDDVKSGYTGPLYAEIVPQTFSIVVRQGTRLNQIRLKQGETIPLYSRDCGVDLTGDLVGFRARRHAGLVDLDQIGGHDPRSFWEPITGAKGQILLDPGEFYILASKEPVEIPVLEAAEMLPIDPSVGEFRVHYAGFFDPGFGTDEAMGKGSKGYWRCDVMKRPFCLRMDKPLRG